MQFGFELGLSIPVIYMVLCEVLSKKPSDNLLILFGGLGLILNSYFGGVGHLSFERSFISSIFGVVLALLFYLPYRPFFQKEWALFYYLTIISVWAGPIYFLQFYAYTALVCGLLSIYLIMRKKHKEGVSLNLFHFFKAPKKNEGNSGVQAPYYTASLLAYLFIMLQKEF